MPPMPRRPARALPIIDAPASRGAASPTTFMRAGSDALRACVLYTPAYSDARVRAVQ